MLDGVPGDPLEIIGSEPQLTANGVKMSEKMMKSIAYIYYTTSSKNIGHEKWSRNGTAKSNETR